MVKELRERTGAGMMECKKALVETNGDMEAAAEHLRMTGLAQADKKASRVAAEGKLALAASEDGKEVVMVEINCETDFVAKDANFLAFTESVAANALTSGAADVETLSETEMNGGTVEQARQALVSKIGENIQIRRISRLKSDHKIGAYVHGGRIGAIIEVEGGDNEVAHDIAMHVAALNPEYIDVDDVPAEVLEKEKQFLISQAADSGKPADIIEKMVSGRMRKHISSITLLGQDFVKDGDMTVAQLLKKNNASVKGMTRLAVGEGIEKKQDNFADEVMQQVKGG
jgi:elongation factor Ts